MKKILLGLGISQLLTLPLISFVSCGQHQTRTLQNQIDKFKDSITKDSKLTIDQAFNGINNPINLEDKKTNLGKIFDIPILDLGFSISQIIPTIDEQNGRNLNVKITIKQASSATNILSKTIVISGLKETTNLDIATSPSTQEEINEAIKAYIDASKDKIAQLSALKLIFVGTGLTIDNLSKLKVEAIAIDGEILGKITLVANPGYIFGTSTTLSSDSSKLPSTLDSEVTKVATSLEQEAAKFKTTIVEAKAQRILATQAANSINSAIGAKAKLNALEKLVILPEISEGFTFEVKSATWNTKNNRSIDVTIAIIETSTSTTKEITFTITGFKAIIRIIVKPSTKEEIQAALKEFKEATTEEDKIAALSKVFDGITPETLKIFED